MPEVSKPPALECSAAVLQASRLTKTYRGASLPAIHELDLTVYEEEIFGLLGPNGAGKTTAISVMCTLMRPTSGMVTICGLDTLRHPARVRSTIGIVPQRVALYERLTARENLTHFGRMYGLKGKPLREAVGAGLAFADLERRADQPVRTFSVGMQRRINLAAGILHRPRLLFLDEPTAGIDAQSRTAILENIMKLKDQGTTIVYTTHYLEEAEALCSRIAIIDQGRLVAHGRSDLLMHQYPGCHDLDDLFLLLTGGRNRH
ncbi:MAG: ABC transporter ATP-binding protein [Desulfobacterales bacterium]